MDIANYKVQNEKYKEYIFCDHERIFVYIFKIFKVNNKGILNIFYYVCLYHPYSRMKSSYFYSVT